MKWRAGAQLFRKVPSTPNRVTSHWLPYVTLCQVRATSHMGTKWWGPFDFHPKVLGVGKAMILCSDGPSNTVWSENGLCWGRDHCVIYWWEKRGNPVSLITHLRSLSFCSFFFSFTLTRSMMDHVERRGGTLVALALYWCLRAWLCNMCLICKHWHSMEHERMPWIWEGRPSVFF